MEKRKRMERVVIAFVALISLSACKCDKPSVTVQKVFDETCRVQCGQRLCQVQVSDSNFPFVYNPQVGEVYSGCDLNPMCKTVTIPTSGVILMTDPSVSPPVFSPLPSPSPCPTYSIIGWAS